MVSCPNCQKCPPTNNKKCCASLNMTILGILQVHSWLICIVVQQSSNWNAFFSRSLFCFHELILPALNVNSYFFYIWPSCWCGRIVWNECGKAGQYFHTQHCVWAWLIIMLDCMIADQWNISTQPCTCRIPRIVMIKEAQPAYNIN